MDLKIPSQAAGPGPVSPPPGDLLSSLRAAGTLEAEVVRLLKDNQLLLTSRLGQIRTSNTLDYRVGDRIELRLDESSGQAVLKTSRAESKPVIIDGRQNPELLRALPPDRPLLARVVRLLGGQVDIRLPDRTVRVARAPEFKPGQLLGIERVDSGRRIDIRPLTDKAMYKAIVRQLLPAAARQRNPALVSLLNFAGAARAGQAQLPAAPAIAGDGGKPVGTVRAAAAGGLAANASGRPEAARLPPSVADAASAPLRPVSGHGGEPGAAAKAFPATARASAGGRAGDAASAQLPRAAATGLAPAANKRSASPESRIPGTPQALAARAKTPGPRPATRAAAAVADATAVGKPAATAGTRDGMKIAAGAAAVKPPADAGHKTVAAASAPALAPAAMAGQAPAARMPPTLPSLEPLLQLVRQLAEIDAPQIRKWFEFARLVRARADAPQAAAADLLRLLRPLGDSEILGRELAQALAKKPAASADSESANVRASQADVAPAQLREGLRLVEQSLVQNLLQRASLGLQQETQQPLNLSLALPFVDQQQIRPLTIDLQQRKQADDPARRSWEVRLGFELGELGCINCHLLLEGRSVAASFYSERGPTRERIEAELPRLRRQLLLAGFEPGEFHSFAGKPAASPSPVAGDFSESLIDIEA